MLPRPGRTFALGLPTRDRQGLNISTAACCQSQMRSRHSLLHIWLISRLEQAACCPRPFVSRLPNAQNVSTASNSESAEISLLCSATCADFALQVEWHWRNLLHCQRGSWCGSLVILLQPHSNRLPSLPDMCRRPYLTGLAHLCLSAACSHQVKSLRKQQAACTRKKSLSSEQAQPAVEFEILQICAGGLEPASGQPLAGCGSRMLSPPVGPSGVQVAQTLKIPT